MKIYRYWAIVEEKSHDAEGRPLLLKKWCGSNESQEMALELAKTALRNLREHAANTVFSSSGDNSYLSYELGARPEEIIDELSEATIITRNRAGALVLNTEHAMFVDVDLPRHIFAKLVRFFKGDPETNAIEKLKNWLAKNPEAGARVYRTAGGLRYLFTHAPLTVNAQTLNWLEALGSDPLYIRLCKVQKCYRARLSPKYWRIKIPAPPNNFPRETLALQADFSKWLSKYNSTAQKFAVCQFIGAFGSKEHHSDLADIIVQHDRATRATTQLPLA